MEDAYYGKATGKKNTRAGCVQLSTLQTRTAVAQVQSNERHPQEISLCHF